MKTNITSRWAFCLASFLALSLSVGCGGDSDMVPVSGTVTIDGQPVAGLTVTFFPEPSDDNNAPGPFSTGITDENGKYTLTNRYGVDGAMVWRHMVSFEYDDVDPEAADEAKDRAMEAKSSGGALSAEDKALAALAKSQMAGKKPIPKRYMEGGGGQLVVDVPAGGTDSLDLEMVSN